MIERINQNKFVDVADFIKDYNIYHDIYITKNNNRIYFENDIDLLKATLKNQECYGLYAEGFHGFFMIIKEKNFRTYLKITADCEKSAIDLIRYFSWTYSEEIYAKLKRRNPFTYLLQESGFTAVAERERELLLFRPKQETK
jgi:hypothetical protein